VRCATFRSVYNAAGAWRVLVRAITDAFSTTQTRLPVPNSNPTGARAAVPVVRVIPLAGVLPPGRVLSVALSSPGAEPFRPCVDPAFDPGTRTGVAMISPAIMPKSPMFHPDTRRVLAITYSRVAPGALPMTAGVQLGAAPAQR
jgi:hypothetical protein